MKRIIFATVAVALIVGLGACGSPSHHGTSPATKLIPPWSLKRGATSCIPKEGAGVPGVCVPKLQSLGPVKLTLRGGFVPDTSYFQHPNWSQAKGHIAGAIVRVADGNFNDPAFPSSWRELRRLGIWHAAYYFLRPGNCAAEADRAVALVNAQGGLDSGPLIEDAEVPLNAGCAEAFVQRVERDTGLPGVIYTAPGTWPGGGHGKALLWVASYGPSPGCVWTCSHVAWQFADGQIGPFPHSTPGIGPGDISLDNGITAITREKPPSHHDLLARQRTLRRVLLRYGCRRRVKQHQKLGPTCRRWFAEGTAVAHRLA